jgi:hypothetical protein
MPPEWFFRIARMAIVTHQPDGPAPPLLLFMKGMDYPHIGLVALAGIALVGTVVHAVRAVQPSPRTD